MAPGACRSPSGGRRGQQAVSAQEGNYGVFVDVGSDASRCQAARSVSEGRARGITPVTATAPARWRHRLRLRAPMSSDALSVTTDVFSESARRSSAVAGEREKIT